MSALKGQIQQGTAEKNWRLSVGIFEDDPVFAEMVRLGREYRQQQREPETP